MEEILKMIEAVDPADTENLDAINERVNQFLGGKYPYTVEEYRDCEGLIDITYNTPGYTRSRDALKLIRPEGQFIEVRKNTDGTFWALGSGVATDNLPTEELAELHAIIQAIAHERSSAS